MNSTADLGPPVGPVPPRIEACRFGLVIVDGRRFTRDVIILPDRVVSDWWRQEGHALAVADLQPLVGNLPQVLVVGLGHMGRMRLLPETSEWLRQRGVELISEPTPAACETYNRQRIERRVAAALHLTC